MVAVVVAWCSVVTVWTKVFCPWCSSHSHSAIEIPHDIQIILFLDVLDGVREFFKEGILYGDLALGHEFCYLWFFVRRTANIPGPNFFAFL